jgi:hypothetical protein
VRLDTWACPVSGSTPVGADPVAVKQGCRGGQDPIARSAAGCYRSARRWPSLFPIVTISTLDGLYSVKGAVVSKVIAERSVYIAPLGGSTWQSPPQVANAWRSHDGASQYQHPPGARPGRRRS